MPLNDVSRNNLKRGQQGDESVTESEQYRDLSKYDKLTMILTTCLNNILKSVEFGTYTRITLIVQNDDNLVFYLWNNGFEVGSFSKELDQTISYQQEDILYIINSVFAEIESNEDEDDRTIPMARADCLGELDGKNIYILPIAYNEGFPKGLLWHKIYEFFVEGWTEILAEPDEHPIFDYSTPDEALQNLYFEWSWVTVACCRTLHEGGFYTGYGDPYESQFLFHVINDMSSLNYEKRQSKGTLVAIPHEKLNQYSLIVKLKDTIPLNEEISKTYRKLLEMTTENVALVFGDFQILGLADADLFDWKITFFGHEKWKFYFRDRVIFSVENGSVTIGKEASQVNEHLIGEGENSITNPEMVEMIVREAMKQEHGTCVLFTNNATNETNRLSKYHRCIQIESINLAHHPELILPLTAIDGALIVDFEGNCTGVGAILDGEAQCIGDFGRGARYNSTVNYIGWKKKKDNQNEYCAVVISEDGVLDVIDTKFIEQIEHDLEGQYTNG